MEITAKEWGDLRQDIGKILATLDPLVDLPDRVASLERDKKDEKTAWERRDKVYIRIFAAVGSIGALVSMATVIISTAHI